VLEEKKEQLCAAATTNFAFFCFGSCA